MLEFHSIEAKVLALNQGYTRNEYVTASSSSPLLVLTRNGSSQLLGPLVDEQDHVCSRGAH